MAQDTRDWLSKAVIYSVFVRNHGQMGTFDEVTRDLERIKDLGTDILWLMPIHPLGIEGRKGTLGSPYAIRDYRGINPEFGDEAALVRLIEGCHRLGMKIIIDVVYNHTSPDSVLAHEHPEWFLRDAAGKPIPKFPEWWDIVDLRYYNADGSRRQELWDCQIASLEKWAGLGIDGFRCDVASLVPPEFWQEARQRLNAKREIIWLAETTHLHFIKFMRDRGFAAWSDGEILQSFDLSYDYDGFQRLDDYFAGKKGLESYLDQLEIQATMNPAHGAKLRFTENHDQPRAAAKIRGTERLECWTAFHALLPGAFMIYAGQEVIADHLPSLFDADPIALPVGMVPGGPAAGSPGSGDRTELAGDPAASLVAAGFDAGQAEFYGFLRRLIGMAKTIKSECRFFSVRQLAAGLELVKWSNQVEASHGAPPAGPHHAASAVNYIAILNLEDRFGPWGELPVIAGTDLLSGQPVALKAGAMIPKCPLIIREA